MDEIWLPIQIDEFKGLYEVSNLGRVKALEKVANTRVFCKKLKEKILRIQNCNGYYRVPLSCDRYTKSYFVHRLVASAFIPNVNNKPNINHLDGNGLNNSIENLEWCTQKENVRHAFETGLRKNPPIGKLNKRSKSIGQFQGNKLIKVWDNQREVLRNLGFSPSNVSRCANGLLNNAYGYNWKFIN